MRENKNKDPVCRQGPLKTLLLFSSYVRSVLIKHFALLSGKDFVGGQLSVPVHSRLSLKGQFSLSLSLRKNTEKKDRDHRPQSLFPKAAGHIRFHSDKGENVRKYCRIRLYERNPLPREGFWKAKKRTPNRVLSTLFYSVLMSLLIDKAFCPFAGKRLC